MMNFIREAARRFGLPRLIIALFLSSLFVIAPFVGVRVDTSLSDVFVRFGMNGIMVLAMIPMIQSGCGLNFGLPLGVIAGLIGACISLELDVAGFPGFALAILISIPFAVGLGLFYAQILNRVKGSEMMIATYVGFFVVALMCLGWTLLPFRSPVMVWGYGGDGLRTTISVEGHWIKILDNFLSFNLGGHFFFPTGMYLFMAAIALIVNFFMRTKTGAEMAAAGTNPDFARASGVDVDRMRTLSVVMSTVLGAIGILVYEQSFGFIQLYMAPFYMAFPAVAAILLGGASIRKAGLANVVVGTFLFQGIVTMTPSVINSMIESDMSEVLRIVISNGMILYALTRREAVRR
ncbi:MAG: ABC transporter permease [Synergistaceae bacterium]|jgi:simple sugar transport system permease protein|nr:ABC transporter permease [Synergistaceae bacterium]